MSSTTSCGAVQELTPTSRKKECAPIHIDRVHTLLKTVQPLTLPYLNREGDVVQLWETHKQELIGAVLRKSGDLCVIPAHKIRNPLGGNPNDLVKSLGNADLKAWDLTFDPIQKTLCIWPRLEAAARNKPLKDGAPLPPGHMKIKGSPLRHLTREELTAKLAAKRDPRDPSRFLYRFVSDPKTGKGSYINQSSSEYTAGRKWYFDPRDQGKYREPNHVDIENAAGNNKVRFAYKDDYYEYGPPKGPHGRSEGNNPPPLPKSADPSMDSFRQELQQTNLTDSYNSTNPGVNSMPAKGRTGGEIGGVACSISYIEGLFDDAASPFLDNHFIALPIGPGGEPPFSEMELKQIFREIAIGIYVHDTAPFFSLHFRENKEKGLDLFPVIHPAYQDTLVGRVMGMLDYIMKGYLNGGVYEYAFIDHWKNHPHWDPGTSQSALEQLIQFTKYCKEKMGEEDKYIPLSALYGSIKPDPEAADALNSFKGFTNSFRIIAKQNGVQKEGNLLLVNSDFDVFYDINPPPEYSEALEAHRRAHGKSPSSHEQMIEIFELTAKQIHDHMAKMPLCKKYIAMLGAISFFSNYFSTLKTSRKTPCLPIEPRVELRGCPSLFPHLPVDRVWKVTLKLCPRDIVKAMILSNKPLLKEYFEHLISLIAYAKGHELLEGVSNAANRLAGLFGKGWEKTDRRSSMREKIVQALKGESLAFVRKDAGPEGQRLLDTNTEAQGVLDKSLDTFVKMISEQILDPFEGMVKEHQKALNNRPYIYGQTYKIVSVLQIKDSLIDSYLERVKSALSDESLKVVELSSRQIVTPNHRSEEESSATGGVVGGCGLQMKKQSIQPSIEGKMILQENVAQLLNLPPEKWCIIEQGGRSNAIVRLFFEDVSPLIEDDYEWMEESLLTSLQTEESCQLKRNFDLQALMREGNKQRFLDLLAVPNFQKNLRDARGRTLLHHAAILADPFYAQKLLEAGFKPTEPDRQGQLPIHYAAMQQEIATLQALFRKDLVNAKASNGATPLSAAILRSSLKAVEFLLEKGAEPAFLVGGYTDLHSAIHEGNIPIIERLLKTPSIHNCLNVCSLEGGTPLILACELNTPSVVKQLLAAGADPKIAKRNGVTAIEIAIRQGSLDLLTCLSRSTKPSMLALSAAAKEGSPEIIKALLPHLYEFMNGSKDTALHVAISHGHLPAALTLIEHSSQPLLSVVNREGKSPLLLAASLGAWTVVEALINKGVRVDKEHISDLLQAPYDPLLKKIFATLKHSPAELQKYVLIAAAAGNDRAILMVLEPLGAELACTGLKGWELPHYAAKSNAFILFGLAMEGSKDLRKPLPQEGNLTLAAIAARSGSTTILRYLANCMRANNAPLDRAYEDKHLLYLAIDEGFESDLLQEGMTNSLLEPCAHDILDSKGRRASHVAAWTGSLALLEKLAFYKADLLSSDKKGLTPLDYAVRAGSVDCVSFLLTQGAPVTGKALYEAASREPTIFSKLLTFSPSQDILAKAMLEATQNHDAETLSILQGTPQQKINPIVHPSPYIKALFQADSTLNVDEALRNMSAKELLSSFMQVTPLHMAAGKASPSGLLAALDTIALQPDAIDVLDNRGATPLFHAIELENEANIALLLQRGANKHHRDYQLCTPMAVACKKGSLATVKQLLQAGTDVNQRALLNRVIPISIAAISGQDAIFQYLISHGANVLLPAKTGDHMIHALAQSGKDHLIRMLVARGVSVNLKDSKGRTAKEHAVSFGHTKTLALLLNLQGTLMEHAEAAKLLMIATAQGHAETVQWLLDRHVDPAFEIESDLNPFIAISSSENVSSLIPLFNDYRVSEIHKHLQIAVREALIKDNLSAVKILFDKGLLIGLDLVPGYTALQIASKYGAPNSTKWLLTQGADPLAPCSSGENSLELAAQSPSFEQFELLLNYIDPEIDQKDMQGKTLLHRAATAGHLKHITLLIAQGADLNIGDVYRCTPLYRAAEMGRSEVVRLLLACGADPNIHSNQKKSPMSVAEEIDMQTAKVFEEFAKLIPVEGETNLHRAVRSGSLFALQFLAASLNKEEINQKDLNGATAFSLALGSKKKEMILPLVYAGAEMSEKENHLIKTFK